MSRISVAVGLDLPTKWLKYEEIDALWYRNKEAARALVEKAKAKS